MPQLILNFHDIPIPETHLPFNLADRPVLGPVQAMQVVDLIGGEHGAISVIRQKPPADQDVVVCKPTDRLRAGHTRKERFKRAGVVYDPRRPWTATAKGRPITGASVKARLQAWFQVSCSYQW
jgi:hypothetical protein